MMADVQRQSGETEQDWCQRVSEEMAFEDEMSSMFFALPHDDDHGESSLHSVGSGGRMVISYDYTLER